LTIILRQSLITGEIPEDWWQANITAIYKKGDRNQAVNYRPVSLTSICCKTMEHILYRHIIEHLENHQILSDNQHGFRPISTYQLVPSYLVILQLSRWYWLVGFHRNSVF
jgi:hypothetical protein